MAVRYFLIGSETKRGQWNKVIFWTSNLMITRSVACTSCPADAHFPGSHHAFYFPWTLFLRRPDYLRAWHGLETVVYSQATQHVAWENSPTFLDATTPPPPSTPNPEWSEARYADLCVAKCRPFLRLCSTRRQRKRTNICCPVAYQNNRIFAILLRYRLIYDERKGHWGLISGFEQLYIVAETDKKTHTPTKLSRWRTTQWVF